MFVIPDDFARKMIALGGEEGRAWMQSLREDSPALPQADAAVD